MRMIFQIWPKWPATFLRFQVILLYFGRNLLYNLICWYQIATSVPIERVFSRGADLVAPKRCSLSGDVITTCMCLKSWWNMKKK